ncbi:hypothetical protein Vretifemale_16742, partial [Volvox reticuliferus]
NGPGAAAVEAQEWLHQAVAITKRLAATLGRLAVPGGSYVSGGYDGVHVSAAAPAVAKQAGAAAAVVLTLPSGPGADKFPSSDSFGASGSTARRLAVRQTAIASRWATSKVTTGAPLPQPQPQPLLERLHRPSDRALQESPPTIFADAEAYIVLSGSAATAAESYTLGMSYLPFAAATLTAALAPTLTRSNISLRSGLATVTWSHVSIAASGAAAGAAAAAAFTPPYLDGKANYLQIHIPVRDFDSSRITACLAYDAKTNTLTGALGTLRFNGTATASSAAASSVIFMSYDREAGRATCFASVTGSFVVAQGPKIVDVASALAASPVGGPVPVTAPAQPADTEADTGLSTPPQVLMAASATPAAGAADGGGAVTADINSTQQISTLPQIGTTPFQPEGAAATKDPSHVVAATVGAVAGAFLLAALALAAFLVVRHHRAMKAETAPGSLSVRSREPGIMYTVPLYEADDSDQRVRRSSSAPQDGNGNDPRVNSTSDSEKGMPKLELLDREKSGGESGDRSNRASADGNGGNGIKGGSIANSARRCPPLPTEASLLSPSP